MLLLETIVRWKYNSEKRLPTYTFQLHAMENNSVCRTIQEKYKIIKAYEAIRQLRRKICNMLTVQSQRFINIKYHSGERDGVIEIYKKSAVTERKRMRKRTFSEIDKQLYQWFLRMRSTNNEIFGDIILQKAEEIAEQLGAREEFTASHGFLDGFKNR